jgi:hypothetical protein
VTGSPANRVEADQPRSITRLSGTVQAESGRPWERLIRISTVDEHIGDQGLFKAGQSQNCCRPESAALATARERSSGH